MHTRKGAAVGLAGAQRRERLRDTLVHDVALIQQLLAALQQFAAAGQQFAAAHERVLGALFGDLLAFFRDLGAFFLRVGVNLHAAVLRVRGANIDLLADLVGDSRERILDGLQGAQLFRQLADLHGGDDVVCDPQDAEHAEQRPAELFRDEVDDLGHERLEHVDHEHARQSPQHRELQAHVALDVQRTFGVVPPLVVEHLFQHPAGEVFDGAREQHAAAAERISGDDVEHLIEQCAALELVDAGPHPSGIIAVVLTGEVALIDPVGKVEQVLAVRDRDGGHIVNDLVDVRHDLRDRPGVVRQVFTEEGLDEVARDRLEHIGREAEFPGILGQVVDHIRNARGGIGIMDGADVRLGAHAHVGARLTADGAAAQVDKADRARIRQRRAGFDVIEGVAGGRGHGGDVDRVHMAGEDNAHAGIGILLRDALIAVDEVHGQDGGLDIEVRHQTVVLQTDDKVAARLRGSGLLDYPLFQVGADGAARLMLICAVGGVLLAVAAGVHGDNGQPLDRSRNIGQAAGLIALGRGEGRKDGRVGVDKVVDALEVLRLRARGRHGFAVGGVEVLGIVIADVMVAVDDIDLQTRNILLQLLQLLCQRRVALLLAVLGQVAGHEKDVGLVRANLLKLFVQDCGALLEQLVDGAGDAGKDVIDGAGDAGKDVIDGAGDAGKDVIDGAKDAVDDAGNAIKKSVDGGNNN